MAKNNDLVAFYTGKAGTDGTGPNTQAVKRMYVKLFPAKAFKLGSWSQNNISYRVRLNVQFSPKEWPLKKNGPVVGDPAFIKDVQRLLKEYGFKNWEQVEYGPIEDQTDIQVPVDCGNDLAIEIFQARLIDQPV